MAEQSTYPPIEEHIEVAAPPAKVWHVVSALGRMREWSPQVLRTFVRGGAVRMGSELVNLNHRGLLVWPTRATVVDLVPHRRIAWRIKDNWTVWSFDLEPTAAGGTRIVHRREAPDGVSQVSQQVTARLLGGQAVFTDELRGGMRQTLARIADEVDAPATPATP